MPHYNRSSPFLYILGQANDKLIIETEMVIKYYIVLGIVSVIGLLSSGILFFLDGYLIYAVEAIAFIIVMAYFLYLIKSIVRENKLTEIAAQTQSKSIFDYHYSNNEMLFSQIQDVYLSVGKTSMVKNTIKATTIFLCIFGIFNIYMIVLSFI